jgi:hypothetical protein
MSRRPLEDPTVRYILMTVQGQDHIDAWENSSAEDKQTEIAKVLAWFAEHGAAGRIVGGEELGWPRDARTVRKRGISDGQFAETKEMLGGFIVVEVGSEAEALEMAAGWPGLVWDDDAVEVRPAGSSPAEAEAQAAGGA